MSNQRQAKTVLIVPRHPIIAPYRVRIYSLTSMPGMRILAYTPEPHSNYHAVKVLQAKIARRSAKL